MIGVIGVNPPTPIAMKQSDEQSRQHAHRRHQIVVHVPNSSRIRLIVYGLVIFTDVKACQNPLKLRVVATRAHTCNRTRESVGKCQSRKQRADHDKHTTIGRSLSSGLQNISSTQAYAFSRTKVIFFASPGTASHAAPTTSHDRGIS